MDSTTPFTLKEAKSSLGYTMFCILLLRLLYNPKRNRNGLHFLSVQSASDLMAPIEKIKVSPWKDSGASFPGHFMKVESTNSPFNFKASLSATPECRGHELFVLMIEALQDLCDISEDAKSNLLRMPPLERHKHLCKVIAEGAAQYEIVIYQAEYLTRDAINTVRDLNSRSGGNLRFFLVSDRPLEEKLIQAEGEGRFISAMPDPEDLSLELIISHGHIFGFKYHDIPLEEGQETASVSGSCEPESLLFGLNSLQKRGMIPADRDELQKLIYTMAQQVYCLTEEQKQPSQELMMVGE